MDGDRRYPQMRAGKQHHRRHGTAKRSARQMRQILGMARKAEAGRIKHRFGDRAGDESAGSAGHGQFDSEPDRVDDRAGIGRIGFARADGFSQSQWHNRQGRSKR